MNDGSDWCTDSPETRKRLFGKVEGDQGDPNDSENIKRLRGEYNILINAGGNNPFSFNPEIMEGRNRKNENVKASDRNNQNDRYEELKKFEKQETPENVEKKSEVDKSNGLEKHSMYSSERGYYTKIVFNEEMKEKMNEMKGKGFETSLTLAKVKDGTLVCSNYENKGAKDAVSIPFHPEKGDVGGVHYHPGRNPFHGGDIRNAFERDKMEFAGIVTDNNVYIIEKTKDTGTFPATLENDFKDMVQKEERANARIEHLRQACKEGQQGDYGAAAKDLVTGINILDYYYPRVIENEAWERAIQSLAEEHHFNFYKGTIDEGVDIYKTVDEIQKEQNEELKKKYGLY